MNHQARQGFESACRDWLEKYFRLYPDATMMKRASKILRFLVASDSSLQGKVEGWAAGIIYFVANEHRYPLGIPEMSNSEAEEFFGITMGTIRKRAAQIGRLIE